MKKLTLTAIAMIVLAFGAVGTTSAESEWFHLADSFFVADGSDTHPTDLVRRVVIPGDIPSDEEAAAAAGGRSFVCLGYASNQTGASGRIKGTISLYKHKTLSDPDAKGPDKTFKVDKRVRSGVFSDCIGMQQVSPGDMVMGEFTFSNFPKFTKANFTKGMNMVMAVANQKLDEDLLFRNDTDPTPDPPPGNPGGGNTGGGGGTPGGGGGDPGGGGAPPSNNEYQAAMQVIGTNRAQLVRPSGGSPGRVAIFCANTQVKPGTRIADPATYGFGATVVQALQQTIAKTGCQFAGPANPTAAQQRAIDRYLSLNPGSGPTAIRRDAAGGFHAEWYRSFQGQSNHQAVPSFSAGVDVVCRNTQPAC